MKLTIAPGFAKADDKLTDRIVVLETTGTLLFGESVELSVDETDEPFITVPDNASQEKLQEFFRRCKLIGFIVAPAQ